MERKAARDGKRDRRGGRERRLKNREGGCMDGECEGEIAA